MNFPMREKAEEKKLEQLISTRIFHKNFKGQNFLKRFLTFSSNNFYNESKVPNLIFKIFIKNFSLRVIIFPHYQSI